MRGQGEAMVLMFNARRGYSTQRCCKKIRHKSSHMLQRGRTQMATKQM